MTSRRDLGLLRPLRSPKEPWFGRARLIAWLAAVAFALPALYAARDYGLAFDSQLVFPYGDALLGYLAGRRPWPLNPYTEDLEAYGPLGALGAIRVPNLAVLPLVPLLWLAVDADARRAARRLLARGRWWSLPGLVALAVG